MAGRSLNRKEGNYLWEHVITKSFQLMAECGPVANLPVVQVNATVLLRGGVVSSNHRAVLQRHPFTARAVYDLCTWEGHVCPLAIQHTTLLWWLRNALIYPSHSPTLFKTIYLVSSIGQGIESYVFPPAFNLGIKHDIIFMGFPRITSSPCTTHVWERKKNIIEVVFNVQWDITQP